MSYRAEEIKNNPLNREFKRRELVAFSMPTIIMMLVISTYSILDVALISRLVSLDSMAAANIAFPVSGILMGIGIMMGRGGSAFVAKKMGEDKGKEACSDFSFLVLWGILIGIITAFLGVFYAEEIARLLGANEVLLQDTVTYLRVLMIFILVHHSFLDDKVLTLENQTDKQNSLLTGWVAGEKKAWNIAP